MRRPKQTREQKKHAREQRAILALRRAAVRYSVTNGDALAFADLTAAADRYAELLTAREQRKLAGVSRGDLERDLEREFDRVLPESLFGGEP